MPTGRTRAREEEKRRKEKEKKEQERIEKEKQLIIDITRHQLLAKRKNMLSRT